MQRKPFISEALLKRCEKEQQQEIERSTRKFDRASLEERKELSMLVEMAVRDGESYSTIAETHSGLGLSEQRLRDLIGPEAAIRDRIERFERFQYA
ncbi:hypothetical protein [Larsenimonas suaedae]|uniref:Uncharacterized protein n=1 Tax=Larsenimonas suaedae TaxID=1851019 RepID=A0ABU1GTX6_9GAMM|nr:hypothetical protein [Larsenimonas suaedae]MCM2971933.1 hypothetical protein [Larsenimonas suaedae]MDR5895485.1 hypothetical protein [Larsenimonas suaedae]